MKFETRVFAALLACFAVAELRVSRRAEQQSGPLPRSRDSQEDCVVIGWAELCSQQLLTARSCFQLRPSDVPVPSCYLQGPKLKAAQLRSARSEHVTSLQTSGELRITGHIQMTSLRFEAEKLSFEDAEVDVWHEVQSDPNESIQYGGAFHVLGGSFTLTRSNLTVRDTRAVVGGGFVVLGDLRVCQDSQISIQNVTAEAGGGFAATGEVVIAGHSTLNITNSHAESEHGGGFYSNKNVTVSTSSTLVICHATAGMSGGGFMAEGKVLISSSTVRIRHSTAKTHGGGFIAQGDVVITEQANVSISNARADQQGGGFQVEANLHVNGASTVSLEDVSAAALGGGFNALGDVVIAGHSTLNITNSRAKSGSGGGFYSESKLTVSSSSTLVICNATAGRYGGGFLALSKVSVCSSRVCIQHATAKLMGGGFGAGGDVVIAEKATVNISNGRAGEQGGGFLVQGRLHVNNSATVSLENVTSGVRGGGFVATGEQVVIADHSTLNIANGHAESTDGGGFFSDSKLIVSNSSTLRIWNSTASKKGGGFLAGGEVVIADRSTLNIGKGHAESIDGGGFYSHDKLTVSTSSTLVICNATGRQGGGFMAEGKVTISSSTVRIRHSTAKTHGGGFLAQGDVVITEQANVSISNGRAGIQGGGFLVEANLHVNGASTVSLENATAGQMGGGFVALAGEVVIAGRSTLNITNSHAESGNGGGFATENSFTLSTSSMLAIRNAAAGIQGGGFWAAGKVSISSSAVRIQHARATGKGGGFASEDQVELIHGSRALLSNTRSGIDGGGFAVKELFLDGSKLFINKSKALQSGTGGRVDGQVLLASQSNLVVHGAEGRDNSSVLAASRLHLREQSNILLESVIGGYGMDLQNADCKKNGVLHHSTFAVTPDSTVNASGRLASGLLFVEGCQSEKIHLTGIYLQAWSSPLLSTRGNPGRVVVEQVRIDYEAPVNNLPVLVVEDGYRIDSLTASCRDCPHGLTFNATKDGRRLALSLENLRCPSTVTVSNGSTTRCDCRDYQITHPDFRDKKTVLVGNIFDTCIFCEPHSYFQNGACQKCGLVSAWSGGGKDVCHTWPLEQSQRMLLFLGAAGVVLMIFIAWEIIKAPLTIVEAKSMVDDVQGKRTFTFSVQGPIVALHKSLSRLLHRWISYYAHGTDLFWLDYDQNSQQVVKVSTIARRKLILENLAVPFDCGACKGALQATDVGFPFIVVTVLITLVVMLPVVINIAVMSGNDFEHITATAILAILPMAVAAALLHVPVAWLLRQSYSRTPFREALGHYEKQIQCTPYTGPDANHPYYQGLQAVTLRGLWQHFEGFILEYNMHFVVANLVRPLTKSKGVSFVTLWGGRQVDYFVSHSWGTGFRHFVRSIHCHALSREGPAWIDAAYWICSFANNQWNIAAELGPDPMSSAFARVLTAGPKEVAMVLDQEVQPLTRVWCLFEFLLASRQQVDLVFVTDVGVVGDDGCKSFDIALEVGNKIKSLQVATCQASSEEDKKNIFDYIISELGSLERMDEQIRSLMGNMLGNNLTKGRRATEDLLKELGQK